MSMVKWEQVSKPKTVGGLGLKSSKEANLASMARLFGDYCMNKTNGGSLSSVLSIKSMTFKTLARLMAPPP